MLASLQNLALLGVGTTADTTNPFSAKLNNTLWVAKTVAEGGDGNLHYKMSKESATKTLSLLMQTNFSGRAEVGHFIADVLERHGDAAALARTGAAVKALCAKFPVYGPAMRASYGYSSSEDRLTVAS